MIDLHNHLMPAVDDGAATLDASRAALCALAAQGVRTVVTTPHLRASQLGDPQAAAAAWARLDTAWNALHRLAVDEFATLRVERGVELMLDVPRVDLADARVRLAGTPFVLVEFPLAMIPPRSAHALFDIAAAGYVPVVAHPERYRVGTNALVLPSAWKEAGACLQVNAGSLTGYYGADVRARAWRLLEAGMADYLASDYHAGPAESPALAAARDACVRRGAAEAHTILASVNPARLVRGERPLAVPALRPPSLWRRRWFGRAGAA